METKTYITLSRLAALQELVQVVLREGLDIIAKKTLGGQYKMGFITCFNTLILKYRILLTNSILVITHQILTHYGKKDIVFCCNRYICG